MSTRRARAIRFMLIASRAYQSMLILSVGAIITLYSYSAIVPSLGY